MTGSNKKKPHIALSDAENALEESFRFSRHYDNLLWAVSAILIAANSGLLAFAFKKPESYKLLPIVCSAGILVTFLSLFFIITFRDIRHRIHTYIEKDLGENKDYIVKLTGGSEVCGQRCVVYIVHLSLAIVWLIIFAAASFDLHRGLLSFLANGCVTKVLFFVLSVLLSALTFCLCKKKKEIKEQRKKEQTLYRLHFRWKYPNDKTGKHVGYIDDDGEKVCWKKTTTQESVPNNGELDWLKMISGEIRNNQSASDTQPKS